MASLSISSIKPLLTWKFRYFEILVGLSQIFGFLTVILGAYYFNSVQQGIQWPKAGFHNQNFHGFFMLIGLIFFQGEALLSYRLYRNEVKVLSKFIHVVFHTLATGFFTTALIAVITQKNDNKWTHFTSVHSWLGLAIMTIYIIQFAFGCINFLMPGIPLAVKQSFMPLHRVVGCISLTLSTIQATIGFIQSTPSCCSTTNNSLACPGHLAWFFNFTVISMVFYSVTILLIVVPPGWKREKTLDEME